MNKKRLLVTLCAICVVGIGILLDAYCWSPLAVRFGSSVTRQIEMAQWVDQRSELSALQRSVLFSLLYTDVHDPDAPNMALGVLRAHIHENEDEVVRHLIYVALTTHNPYTCNLALCGLRSASPKHRRIALAVLSYELNHSDPREKENWQKIATAVGGLASYSYREALPAIRQLTNSPSELLRAAAEEAVKRLEEAPGGKD